MVLKEILSRHFSKDHLIAIAQAFFVTILWSSSWVIIKFGLEEMPPLIFAGLRYLLGAVVLFVLIFSNKENRKSLTTQTKHWWVLIGLYGCIFITVTQGGQFIALNLLPAITVSFALNLTPIVVIFLSIGILKEVPSSMQIFLFLITVIGVVFYFFPINLTIELLGILVLCLLISANAFSSILGRAINRTETASPLIVAGVSMAIGSIIMLICGIAIDGIQIIFSLSTLSILYIIWLAVVNTALAFTIWNKAMQRLRAMDMTIINSTMLPQIVILSIIFLGEMPILKEWIGLFLIVISTLLIQLSQARKNSNLSS
ncbi:MAG: EamA family transporter [Candidatus Heimdallarchaeota archaeon]|nr:MAG: EamA family transporter [Candidatus Heimdallarchaeota archaeon]